MTKTQKLETSKKQTWWVVFMVGLMVVLSAYYWLSDDAPKPVATTFPVQSEEMTIDPNDPPAVPPAPIEPQKTEQKTEQKTDAKTEQKTEQKTDAKTEQKPDAKTDASRSDAAILSEVAATPKGVEAVAAMQMERSSHVSQQLEQLTAKMTDSEATDDQIAEASEQHDALMDRESKIIALEEQLMQQYAHVVVTFDDAQQFTVNVHAPSLSNIEAANMLTAAIEQLHAAPQNVAVKLIR